MLRFSKDQLVHFANRGDLYVQLPFPLLNASFLVSVSLPLIFLLFLHFYCFLNMSFNNKPYL